MAPSGKENATHGKQPPQKRSWPKSDGWRRREPRRSRARARRRPSRAQPQSRRAVNSRARERVEDGGGDLAQRGVGRPRARPALGGAAGRLGARAVALKQPKIAAAGIGDLQSASLRPVRAAARLFRGSPACPGAVLTRGAERGAAAVEPGPWRLRDEPNRAPQRWRSKKSPAAARSCAASPQRFCVARPRLS